MNLPTVEIVPLRGAVRSDSTSSLDLLLRILPPSPKTKLQRPPLNLGLVLDRSSSMTGHKKMDYARDAAIFAVQQLTDTDRISVTTFDDKIETIIPNTTGQNKAIIVNAIRRIEPRGSTDLHGGWKEGAQQVEQHLLSKGINRVLILSDGQTNQGETDPDKISSATHALARKGVSTTTLGVGDDYNEDLMEAMARSGDGNYYFIEAPEQLAAIFQTELTGLMAMSGHTMSLGLEPSKGVEVSDVLNDLDSLPTGRWKLPNLIAGMPITVALRLKVEAFRGEREICKFRVAWTSPEDSKRHSFTVALKLPAVGETAWEKLEPNAEVQEHFALLHIARDKKRATEMYEHGNHAGAEKVLADACIVLAYCPASPEIREEQAALAGLQQQLANGEGDKFRKAGKFQAYQRRQSKNAT